eukprot:1794733-Rhodomonas_salina.2
MNNRQPWRALLLAPWHPRHAHTLSSTSLPRAPTCAASAVGLNSPHLTQPCSHHPVSSSPFLF